MARIRVRGDVLRMQVSLPMLVGGGEVGVPGRIGGGRIPGRIGGTAAPKGGAAEGPWAVPKGGRIPACPLASGTGPGGPLGAPWNGAGL